MKKKWVLRQWDFDLWPKVTKFNRVRANAGSNHLAKTATKSVHPFGWNFVHKKYLTHTHRHIDKLQWKYNPSTTSWRCKQKKIDSNLRVASSLGTSCICEMYCFIKQMLLQIGPTGRLFFGWDIKPRSRNGNDWWI